MVQNDISPDSKSKEEGRMKMHKGGASGAVYGLGFVGAAIYYIQYAPTFWMGVLGVLKAVIWPVFLVYNVFVFLKV